MIHVANHIGLLPLPIILVELLGQKLLTTFRCRWI